MYALAGKNRSVVRTVCDLPVDVVPFGISETGRSVGLPQGSTRLVSAR
jgi:hypothetical protein